MTVQHGRYSLVRNHSATANHKVRSDEATPRTVSAPESAPINPNRTVIAAKSNRTVISGAAPSANTSQTQRIVVPGKYCTSLSCIYLGLKKVA